MTKSITTAEKYKRLRLETGPVSAGGDSVALAALNGRFNPDDFYVARNGDGVDIWLRQANLEELAAAVAAVAAQYGCRDTLQGIIRQVESVRSYGVNGNKRLYVGFNAERKVANRKEKERERGKHYYAHGRGFHRDNNLLPADFANRIICGDSEERLQQLPDNCIDLVFTSPSYNFGLGYQETGDADHWAAYFAKLFRVFDQCIRVLKYGGRIVVNVQPLFSDYIPSHHILSNYFMERGLIWKGEILWEKNNYNCKYTAWGSWKSPSSPYLKYTWEFVEVFCKGSLVKKGQAADADIDADSFKEWVTAKWSIAPERRMKEFDHPAMFPEELARRVLLLFSFSGDAILDPFAGVGTTCVVARRHNRQFLGIDIAPEYCATAEQRLSDIQLRGL